MVHLPLFLLPHFSSLGHLRRIEVRAVFHSFLELVTALEVQLRSSGCGLGHSYVIKIHLVGRFLPSGSGLCIENSSINMLLMFRIIGVRLQLLTSIWYRTDQFTWSNFALVNPNNVPVSQPCRSTAYPRNEQAPF